MKESRNHEYFEVNYCRGNNRLGLYSKRCVGLDVPTVAEILGRKNPEKFRFIQVKTHVYSGVGEGEVANWLVIAGQFAKIVRRRSQFR